MEKIKKRKRKKYEMAGLFFILPSLIGVSIFILIPFADVVIRSFQSPITRDFVFFHNYMEVFKNAAFKLAAINTLKFVFICIESGYGSLCRRDCLYDNKSQCEGRTFYRCRGL